MQTFLQLLSQRKFKIIDGELGVIPVVTEKPDSTDDMFELAEKVALEQGLVESGDDIVIVAGVPVGVSGSTNTMRVRTVK